jgi:serine/threonine protein kinase
MDTLKKEIIYLKKLDSPNIVKYYETYEDANYVYLVMEYCPGKDLYEILSRRLKRNRFLKEEEVIDIMYKVFKAIGHCHALGIAHRDIKPENIIIGKEGELKVIDFGLAQRFSDKQEKNIGKMIGTPYYLAPEAIEGTTSIEGDLWSLGVLIFVLLTGTYPFNGETPSDILNSIDTCSYDILQSSGLKNLSEAGKDLLGKLI